MAKKFFGWLATVLFAVTCLLMAACTGEVKPGGDDGELVLTGFDVPAETEVSYGSIYTIPVYVVKDQNGKLYTVEYVVTNGDDTISVVGGQIRIDRSTDYLITFTVIIGEGENQQKKTTLKVMDADKPKVSMEGMKKSYVVGETIAFPEIEVTDNLDTGLTATVEVKQGDTVVLSDVKADFSLNERGAYTLVATAVDSAGNEGTAVADFVVRNQPYTGEIEDFSDEYAAFSVSPKADYGETLTGETAEIGGVTAYKVASTDTTGANTKYPGLSLAPRISLEAIKELKEAGFDAVTMNLYLEDTQSRYLYHKWVYTTDEEGNPTGHKQTNLGSIRNNVWTAVTLDLDLFIGAYDDIASGEILLFYFGNDPDWTTQTEFNYYVKDIYVTRQLTDIAITESLSETYDKGASVDLSGVTAASASAADAGFELSVTDPAGNVLVPQGGVVTAEEYGVYTVTARPDAASKRYLGESSVTFAVLPTLEVIEEKMEGIMTATDMTDAGVIADAALLANWLDLVGQVEGGETIDMFRYYAAMNLTNDAALKAEGNKLMYFDTALGAAQISTSFVAGKDPETAVATKEYIFVDPDTTYDGKPTTKIGFDDVNGGKETWCCPFYVTFALPASADLSGYSHIRFYLKGYSYEADRPVEYAVLYNGKRFIQPTVLTTGEWTEVRIDLAANGITDLSKLKIGFYTKDGSNEWGTIWNNSDKFYAHISSVYGIIAVDDVTIDSAFTAEETYDLGDTLDLSGFKADSATYPGLSYVYEMEYNGKTETLPASITFTTPGWYTLKAIVNEGDYTGTASVRFYVNGSEETPTVEMIQETIEAILAAENKEDAAIVEKAELLSAWLDQLDTVYGSEVLDMFRYYLAMTRMETEEGKLVYFDSELGKEQISLEYNKNVPVETKNGISLDTSTTYDGKPTTKISFTDVTGWFSPFLINIDSYDENVDLGDYVYLRFWLKGYSGLMNKNRPLEYAMLYNGKRFIEPTVLTNGEWTEVTIDLKANNITDLGGLTLAFYSLNNGDIWGSLESSYFYAHITAIYGVTYDETLPKAAEIIQVIDDILDAEDMSAAEVVAMAGQLKEWLAVLDGVEGKDTIDMFRYYAAMNLIGLEDGKLMYFDTALGTDQISTSFVAGKDPETAVATKEYIFVDQETTYDGKPTTKIGFDDVNGGKETWCCPFYVTFALPSTADLSGYSHIRFALKGYTYEADRPVEYAVLYNGKRFIQPTVLTTGEWTEVTIDLAANGITDLSKLKIGFYTKDGSNEWGSIWNSSERFHVYISAVYGVRAVSDLQLNGEFPTARVFRTGEAPDLAKFTVTSAANPGLAYEYTVNGAPMSEANLNAEGVYELKATVATEWYSGELSVTILVADTSKAYVMAEAESTISQIVPRGYGSDKTVNSYLADFNGRKAIKAVCDPEAGANGNAYKWPGIDIHTALTKEFLTEMKALGYTTMVIPVYIADSSVSSHTIHYGATGNEKIATVTTGEWTELEIPIDTLISSYDSTLSNYFFYIENSKNGSNYFTYYVSDITLIQKA